MIRINIGNSERDINSADPSWINKGINGRRTDGLPVCVRITIKEDGLNLILASGECSCGVGDPGRTPNPQEQKIFDLWNKHRLNGAGFAGGQLVAFLKQLGSIL